MRTTIEKEKLPYRDKNILHNLLVVSGLTQKEVAEKLGCSESTIGLWANRLNVIKPKTPVYLSKYKKICLDWDYRNNKKNPSSITHGSRYKASWLCHKCDYRWEAKVKSRTIMKSGCPNCAGMIVNDTNRFSSLYPELIKEWDFNNNKLNPSDVTYASHRKAFWICGNCSKKYSAVIRNRTINSSSCPYCSGNAVSELNSLAQNLPRHALDWDYTKNKISPEQVSVGSSRSYYWKCHSCSKEWSATINNKKNTNKGCPYCSGHRISSWNNLQVDNPTLAKEFDVNRNGISPDQVHRGTKKIYWWNCPNGHEDFQASVNNRNLHGSSCPKCSSILKTSYPEQTIHFYFKKIFKNTANGKQISCKNKIQEADVFIEQLNLVIEYDGWYWHKNKQEKDQTKNKEFKDSGYSVIRVLENGLKPIKYCTTFYIDSYYESTLDNIVRSLFQHVLKNFRDKITNEQRELLEHIEINHEKDRAKIESFLNNY